MRRSGFMLFGGCFMLLGACCVVSAGCLPDRRPDTRGGNAEVARHEDGAALTRRMVRIHRLVVPAGGAEAAYPLIDETAVPEGDRARLEANGVRAGLGLVADLANVAAMLATETVETSSTVASGYGPQEFGVPLPDQHHSRRPPGVLLWQGEGGPGGRSFHAADLTLRVTFSGTPGPDLRATRLRFEPQLTTRRALTRFFSDGRDALVPGEVTDRLTAAALQLDVPDGHFVILSSLDRAATTGIGRALFTLGHEGKGAGGAEVVLFVVPEYATLRPVLLPADPYPPAAQSASASPVEAITSAYTRP